MALGAQSLALVAIVKDEAARIDACLASVRPYIEHFVVVDTGSTDDTPQRVEAALQGIPGKLWHLPFVDFGHSRSEAFVWARGTADWLLCLDADMTVEIDPDFEPDPAVEAYMIEMGNGDGFSWRLPLLLRGALPWRSVGKVHAYTALPGRDYVRQPTDAVRIYRKDSHTPEKTRRQADILEAELGEHPDDARTVFYLAQTYRELGDPRALELYRRRAGMGGFAEERWYAQYRAALLESDWPIRNAALMAAWEARPSRLEPLCALVKELRERKQHQSVYRLTSDLPAATPDTLFVHTWARDWGIAFERSVSAWWVGDKAEAARLNEELLANPKLPAPERAAVLRNMTYAT